MILATDRRSVIAGLGALGLAGCGAALSARGETASHFDLSALEARHGGRLGVCAARGGDRVSWRGDERFATASTFKLFLAAAVLDRAARGEERLDRAVPITAADMLSHAPVTGPALGRTLTVEQLCAAAIQQSDNPAANLLFAAIGGPPALTAFYRSLGDTVTRSDRTELELNSAIKGDPRDTASPVATVGNLDALLLSDRLSPADRARLEHWLTTSVPGEDRIKAGVPAGWRVGHKTGTGSNGATNDIGILRPPSGAPVLIAVYFTEAPGATSDQRAAVVAAATRSALKALGVQGAAA